MLSSMTKVTSARKITDYELGHFDPIVRLIKSDLVKFLV